MIVPRPLDEYFDVTLILVAMILCRQLMQLKRESVSVKKQVLLSERNLQV
jgi:hypothetical protein